MSLLDFNPTSTLDADPLDEALNRLIDEGLTRKRAQQERRAYLGASAVGHDCERASQYEFAGAPRERDFEPKTLRKFDLGHFGEELARAWFLDAGFRLTNTNQRTGRPYGFEQMGARFKGHVDGVFLEGPDVPGVSYPCLWEHKTVGNATFREVKRDGLKKARFEYYAQVQVYMAYLGLTASPCIFTLTNSESGEQLHMPIRFDAEEAQRMTDRAVRIIQATDAGELLPRAYRDPSHFKCRFCPFSGRCWGQQ